MVKRQFGSNKPVIEYHQEDPDPAITETINVLKSQNVAFNNGGRAVRVVDRPVETIGGVDIITKVLEPIDKDAMLDEIGRACHYKSLRWDERKKAEVATRIPVPPRLAAAIASRNGAGFNPLYVIANMPLMARDGTVTAVNGYDRANGIYVDAGPNPPVVPDTPSHADALKALTLLQKPLRGFPFVSELDKTVATAAILSGCYLPSVLSIRPAVGISAKTKATGKTKLTEVIATIIEGSEIGLITAADRPEETDKRFDSRLIQGARVIGVDNVDNSIGSATLCTALTSTHYMARVLGTSKTVRVRSPLVILNGNNLSLTGDVTRRVLMCNLDAGMPDPERRKFDFDALEEAGLQRPSLVAAALTILRAFQVAGAPEQEGLAFGSFERWTELVRDPLMWLGLPDIVAAQAASRETMAATAARQAQRNKDQILVGLYAVWPNTPVSSSEIVDWSTSIMDDWEKINPAQADIECALNAALFSVAERRDGLRLCNQRVGQYLSELTGHRSGQRWLQEKKVSRGYNRWTPR